MTNINVHIDGPLVGQSSVCERILRVLPEYQHLGIGRAMLCRAEDYLREQGVDYLQVKWIGNRNHE